MTITCTVNGVAYSLSDSWSVSQQGGAVSTSSIDVLVPAGVTPPRPWALVVLAESGTPFFRGFVSSVSSPEYSSGYEVKRYRLTVNSAECLFNNRLVSEVYENVTATELIQNLFDSYIAGENITLGAIANIDYTYPSYACQYSKLYDVLCEIATDNNASFYTSADNKFYFITRDHFDQIDAPENITGLAIENESGDLRTVQIVSGASEETSSTTETVFWTAGLGSFPVGYAVKTVTGMTIQGNPVGVGVIGVDEDNAAKSFLYAVGSNIITLNQTATTQPASGEMVTIVYGGYYDIDVTETNEVLRADLSAMNGTSGIIETQYTDETLSEYATADAKALALLDAYDDFEQTISCQWRGDTLDNTALYTMWLFDRSDLNITGQYVVVERSIGAFGKDKYSIKLTLKNKNFFQRYGTLLTRVKKQALTDIKVYKNMKVSESVSALDSFEISAGDIVFYPSDSFIDPCFSESFYPGY